MFYLTWLKLRQDPVHFVNLTWMVYLWSKDDRGYSGPSLCNLHVLNGLNITFSQIVYLSNVYSLEQTPSGFFNSCCKELQLDLTRPELNPMIHYCYVMKLV